LRKRKTNKYYFSVEGETEQWYFQWLQDIINSCDEATNNVSFDCKVQKNPLKRAKSMVITGKTEIWHISDYESDDEIHVKQFHETIDNMRSASNIGKQITYKFGYSNFTFDLWIILHKADCNGSQSNRKNYLGYLNRAYGESFESMDEYKHEDNFKRCLRQLDINNVIQAVTRAKNIMERNKENVYVLQNYKGYTYYKENPSLAIWEIVEKILVENIIFSKL
jgi:hypothetical protein